MDKKVSVAKPRLGQGRILGLLGLWLEYGPKVDREQHIGKDLKKDLASSKFRAERQRIRRALKDSPHWDLLSRAEAPKLSPDEDSEPEIVY